MLEKTLNGYMLMLMASYKSMMTIVGYVRKKDISWLHVGDNGWLRVNDDNSWLC